MDQIVLVCDEHGNFSGEYIAKELAHTGDGVKHLAIAVLLYNSEGQVLLQQRKHRVFDNIWDLTGATHPLHLSDGSNESFEDAALRCLKVEYDIDKISLTDVGAFSYFARYGKLCENEFCRVLIGEYNGDFELNPEVGYGFKWMDKKEFIADIERNPEKYTAWAQEGAMVLKGVGFFN